MRIRILKWASQIAITTLMAAFALSGTGMAATTMKMIVPAYFDPSYDPSDWTLMMSAQTGSIIIMNPDNGPYIGTSKTAIDQATDPTAVSFQNMYKNQIAAAHAHGLLAIGYVSTSGGCRSYYPYFNGRGDYNQGVYADIDEWRNLYGVDGIFLDEGPGGGTWNSPLPNFKDYSTHQWLTPYPTSSTTGQQYYTPVYNRVLSDFPTGPVVLNCGIPTDEGYMNVCSILCDAEEPYNTYMTNSWLAGQFAPGAWYYKYPASRFLHLVYGLASGSTANVASAMARAQAWNASNVYFTDRSGWTALATPPVWNSEITY